jgi:hypothetical protein
MSSSAKLLIANFVVGALSVLGGGLAFIHFGLNAETTEGIVILSLIALIVQERLLNFIEIISNERIFAKIYGASFIT